MRDRHRVLVVDDHPIFRRGLRAELELQEWVDTIIEADNAADAVQAARDSQITVVAMDIGLPDFDGIEATTRILKIRPLANILMLTVLDDDDIVFRALRAGAHGYARKDIPPDRLMHALSTIADGGVVLGPAVGSNVLASLRHTPAALPEPFDRLTERERQILARLATGDNNARIARRIGISEKTVRNQVSALFAKLGVPDRVHAALLVRDTGVLPLLGPGQ